MRTSARAALVALTTVLALGALAVPAQAASPAKVSSTPADGARLKTAPSGVSVVFDQNVASGSTLTVAGPSGVSPCTTTSTAASSTLACTFSGFPTPSVPDGSYTASYTAKSTGADPQTTGTIAFVVDTAAPAAPSGLAVTPSPYLAASDTLTVTGTTESATDSVRVTLTGGAARTVTPASDRTFSATFTSAEVRAAADGTVTATAVATDAAGNAGAAATRTFTKDVARPTVTATTPADGAGVKPSATFAYTATASEALEQTAPETTVRLFTSTGDQLAATVTYPSTTSVRATPTATLPDGTYTARIFLTDLNGNTNDPSPTERSFTVDGTVPTAPVLATPLTTVTKANVTAWPVSGRGEAGASLTVTAGSVTKTITVPAGGSWSTTMDLTAVADGTVSVTARQTDAAGNVSPVSATATTAKDTVAPAVTGQAVTPATMGTGATTATVTGSVNDGGGPVPPAAAENTAVRVTADDADPATSPVVVDGTSPSGRFSIAVDTASLTDGTITYRIVATDAVGNASTAVTTTNTKDTAAPAAPTVTIAPSTINNANKTAVTVSGSAAGTSVRIVLADGDAATADLVQTVTPSGGSYTATFNTTALADGTITATVTSTDAGGNTGAAGTATARKDTVAPAGPTALTVPATVNGGTLPVSGKAEAGSTVRVTVTDAATPAGSATATAVAGADGSWSLTVDVSGLAQGTLTVSAAATDTAGNTGPAATATSRKDTVAPDQPATVTISPTTYTPSSTTLTVSGTTSTGDRSAGDLTATVVLSDGATPPTTLTATVAVSPATTGATAGTFSTTFTSEQVRTLRDGTLTASVTFKDAAGNTSPARTATSTKDTTVLDVESTSPVNGAVVRPPARVTVTFNEAITSTTATPASDRSSITVKNRSGLTLAGAASVEGRTLVFTPESPLSEQGGPFTVTYRGVDAALTSETKDGSFSFTVDNTPPAAPVITSVTDPVTQANQKMVEVRGTVEAPGLPVTVTIGGTIVVTTTSGAGGAFAVTVDVTSLPDGTVTVTATAKDAAGNTSAAGTTTTRKDATSPTLVSAVPADGARVTPPATVTLTFSESLGSGSITIPGVAGSSTVSGRTVTFTPTTPFADGTYTATASATDTVGNAGSGSTTFTVDGTAPAAPVVTAVTDPVNLGNQTAVVVRGTAEAGARVTVTIGTLTASTTAGRDGAWTVTLDVTALADGTLTATATATDALGNTSPSSAPVTTTKDTVRPALTAVVPADGSTVAAPSSVRFTFSEALGSGAVTIDGVSGTSTVSGSTVTFTPSAPFASGRYTASATVTDTAGNAPAGTPTTTFTVDATGPTVSGLAATATSTTRQTTTVTGTRSEASTVAVAVTDGVRTVTAAVPVGTGAFSVALDLTTLGDGPLTVTATATDAVGNVGPTAQAGAARDITAPTVSGLSATGTTRSSSVTTVTGTRSETATVALTATDGTRTVRGTVPSGTGSFTATLDLTGFTPGTVTVKAVPTDAAGNVGPEATTTLTHVGPPAATTTTLTVSTTRLVNGATLTLSGKVTRPNGGTAQPVRLEAVSDRGMRVDLGTVTLAADGTFTKTLKPSRNGRYTATYPGDADNAASTSPQRRVVVAPRVTGSSKTGRATVKAVVTGAVSPATTGTQVVLYRLAGGKATRLATTTVRNGRYSFSVKLPKGSTRLEVRVAQTPDNGVGTVRLTARRT